MQLPITPRGRRYLKSASVAWEQSASLLSGLLEEQDRQKRELELAREVQAYFLPSLAPAAGLGLDMAGRYRPAREVGGDYYDVIRLSDTAVALALGDVSGKGIAAALLMATLRAFVRSQPGNPEQLAADMSRLNHLLRESCTSNRFATLFYAVYNAPGRPRVRECGTSSSDAAGCLPRTRPPSSFVAEALCWACCLTAPMRWGAFDSTPEACWLSSDGLTEACNRTESDWGEERLISAMRSKRTQSAAVLADHLMAEVTRFVAGGPQQDDMTLLVAQRAQRAGQAHTGEHETRTT